MTTFRQRNRWTRRTSGPANMIGAGPVPKRLDELVIYEMHVGRLGFGERDAAGNPLPGSFRDAIALLDQLVELGINAIELMPMSEAEGWSWGYGTSHYSAIEYSGGGQQPQPWLNPPPIVPQNPQEPWMQHGAPALPPLPFAMCISIR